MLIWYSCKSWSIVYMLESQATYIADALRVMRDERAATVEVTGDAQRRYNDGLDPQLARTVWNAGGCDSWYLTSTCTTSPVIRESTSVRP